MTGAFPGVLFDLDGTLADTPGAIAEITGGILRERGLTPDPSAVLASVGKPLDHNFALFFGLPVEHPDVARALAAYRQAFGEHVRARGPALLYPGVADGLARLAAAGCQLGIATSKIQIAGEELVRRTGIADRFAVVAGHDTTSRGKPHPDMALYAADKLGLRPEECLVVGDSVADVEMGRAAGMTVFGVSYGVATAAELGGAGAALVADSFADLVPAIVAGTA
ncbi:HAD family hydrolase [Streptomyces polygonati]|uniref:HAD family hydrolase n=1 Tax=Streptomyces polygonati TaxID=1617087 RepID=A0ABV8HJ64_9ACTN